MCLLERVVEWDDRRVVLETATHRSPTNPLRVDGRLRAVHLCEYGAQAMAVHGGLRGTRTGAQPKPGMLVSLRSVHVRTRLHRGSAGRSAGRGANVCRRRGAACSTASGSRTTEGDGWSREGRAAARALSASRRIRQAAILEQQRRRERLAAAMPFEQRRTAPASSVRMHRCAARARRSRVASVFEQARRPRGCARGTPRRRARRAGRDSARRTRAATPDRACTASLRFALSCDQSRMKFCIAWFSAFAVVQLRRQAARCWRYR